MWGVRVRVLGVLTVLVGRDGPLPIPHSCHSLLGYLITHRRRPVFRRELAETLWPDHDGNHARRCLSTALWRVKKATNGSTSLLSFSTAGGGGFYLSAKRSGGLSGLAL